MPLPSWGIWAPPWHSGRSPPPFCVPRGQTTSCLDGLLELEADPLHPTVTCTDQAASISARTPRPDLAAAGLPT